MKDSLQANEQIAHHRRRLKRVVQLRLDPRLRTRVDESDIVQEALVEAARRADSGTAPPDVPVFVWLRGIALERIIMCHRKHLGAAMRSLQREQSLCHADLNSASHELSLQLAAANRTPSSEAVRNEMQERVQQALLALPDRDREIVLLRHFEQMDNVEVASALHMNPSTTSSRYLRALSRIRNALESLWVE